MTEGALHFISRVATTNDPKLGDFRPRTFIVSQFRPGEVCRPVVAGLAPPEALGEHLFWAPLSWLLVAAGGNPWGSLAGRLSLQSLSLFSHGLPLCSFSYQDTGHWV